jgi:hypothetical protein
MKRAMADNPGSCAIPAIGGTEIQGKQQDPVRISVHESGHRALMLFAEGIVRLFRCADKFVYRGNNASSQRRCRISMRDETHIVGSYPHRKLGCETLQCGLLFG